MRRGPLVSILALVLVSLGGCLSDADDDEGPQEEPSFLRTVSVVDPRGGHGEPSLGVTPDGILFTNGQAHVERGTDPGAVFRSGDGGKTWDQIGTPTAPYPNFDPDLAVDLDGNVWFDTLYVGCATVSVSQDKGDSWSDPNPAACTGPGGDRQYVVPTRGGEAFIYYHQVPTLQQTAAKTTDYGATWTPTGPVESPDHHLVLNEGSGWGGGGFWNPAQDSVWFTFSWFRDGLAGDGGWAPAYAVTRDDGESWEVGFGPQPSGKPMGLSLVVGAADEAGNVYLAWAEDHEDQNGIYLATSTDDGKTWSDAIRVDNTSSSKLFPAITAGADGEVAVAYYTANEEGHPQTLSDQAKWDVVLAWTGDALADEVVFERDTLSNRTVKEGRICPSGATCEGDREFLDYFQIKRLPDGRIGAVYNSLLEVEGENVVVFAMTEPTLMAPWGWR